MFGRNVASYKFALGKSLLELAGQDSDAVTLGELAVPFARHLCEHLQLSDKQGTFAQRRFLDACRAYNRGELTQTQLVEQTARLGFNNVIDAFHVVNHGYQKGRCFYCRRDIEAGHADVDHFLPHTLLPSVVVPNIDGIWNLVLACADCSRGPGAKSARVPELQFLERLHQGNEFLSTSHHPLRETLILQTGATPPHSPETGHAISRC